MAHTPGPWRISESWRPPMNGISHTRDRTNANGDVFWGYSISGSNEHGGSILPTLAAVHNFPDNIDDNAKLISAAPDLLAACEEFVRKVECGEAKSVRSYAQMKAAIAKAKE